MLSRLGAKARDRCELVRARARPGGPRSGLWILLMLMSGRDNLCIIFCFIIVRLNRLA